MKKRSLNTERVGEINGRSTRFRTLDLLNRGMKGKKR